MTETNELLRLGSGKGLVSGIKVYIEVLRRIGVIQSVRHVHLNSAESIDYIDKPVKVHYSALIYIDSECFLKYVAELSESRHTGLLFAFAFVQRLTVVSAEGCVDLACRHAVTHIRIARELHYRNLGIGNIVIDKHYYIGQKRRTVMTEDKKVIISFFIFQCDDLSVSLFIRDYICVFVVISHGGLIRQKIISTQNYGKSCHNKSCNTNDKKSFEYFSRHIAPDLFQLSLILRR